MSPLESLLAEINQLDRDLESSIHHIDRNHIFGLPDLLRRQNGLVRQLMFMLLKERQELGEAPDAATNQGELCEILV